MLIISAKAEKIWIFDKFCQNKGNLRKIFSLFFDFGYDFCSKKGENYASVFELDKMYMRQLRYLQV